MAVMKNESIEDELKLLKMDILTIQKNFYEDINGIDRVIINMRAHINYLFDKFELKLPEKKQCMRCEGYGTIYISPISDCGQSNVCTYCAGKGFKYV